MAFSIKINMEILTPEIEGVPINEDELKRYIERFLRALRQDILRLHQGETEVLVSSIKYGATSAAAGASSTEPWCTSAHASLPDGVMMLAD